MGTLQPRVYNKMAYTNGARQAISNSWKVRDRKGYIPQLEGAFEYKLENSPNPPSQPEAGAKAGAL